MLLLHVQPGASRTQVVGLHGDRLKIKVKAPPVDGAANDEIVAFVAGVLGVARRDLEIVAGLTSRQKTLLVRAGASAGVSAGAGLTDAGLRAALAAAGGGGGGRD